MLDMMHQLWYADLSPKAALEVLYSDARPARDADGRVVDIDHLLGSMHGDYTGMDPSLSAKIVEPGFRS